MAASSQSPEARELSLVGKVEMRIAMADSDDKLESILKTYLPPLLLKLASEHVSVRNKVISICQHINTRIKPRSIKLPVAALLEQYKANPHSQFVRQFDLLYIRQGVGRMSAAESDALFPIAVRGISTDRSVTSAHAATMFNMLLQLSKHFQLPPRGTREDQDLRSTLNIGEDDAKYLASRFGLLLLFTPVKARGDSCPGLTPAECDFLTVQHNVETWKPTSPFGLNLTETKASVAKLLASGIFTDEERFLPALFAAADPASSISGVGEDMLKRALPSISLEDRQIIEELHLYYFGEDYPQGRRRVRVPLRLRILGLLNKSTISTTYPEKIISLVDDGITSSATDATNGAMPMATTGREASKLRAAVFTYINFVARYGSQESLYAVAPRVLGRLKDFIEGQGWPRPGGNEDLVSRGYAYEVMGLLGKAGPSDLVVEPNLDVLQWLFESLALEISSNSITVSIEEALSSLIGAFAKGLDSVTTTSLENLLVDQMYKSEQAQQDGKLRSTRYVAVRYANRCLPYDSVKGRWINILAVGGDRNDRPEVKEEGRRGLSPYYYRMLNGSNNVESSDTLLQFPAFADVMEFAFYQASAEGRPLSETPWGAVSHLRTARPGAFYEAIKYCWHLFVQEALRSCSAKPKLDSEWERKVDAAIESDEAVRDAVRRHIRECFGSPTSSTTLQLLMFAFSSGLLAGGRNTQANQADADNMFLDLCALSPDRLVGSVAPFYGSLEQGILSNKHSERQIAAHVFGLLASHPDVQANDSADLQRRVEALLAKTGSWREAVGAAANQVHGAVLALGFYFSRLAVRSGQTSLSDTAYASFVGMAAEMLQNSSDSLIKEGAFSAIGELCLFQNFKPAMLPDADSFKAIIDRTADIAKAGNEKAALALGQMAMVLEETANTEENADKSILAHVEERLHKLHEIRQAESQFSVGEALTYFASGWQSKALATRLDLDASIPSGPARVDTLERLLEKMLRDSQNTKPALRKASVIWLLCIVQFCGYLGPVQQRLADFQGAFKRCLTDRDELIQETASRGLGLVYEKGSRQVKDDLVRDLVGSFSDSNKTQLAGNVSEETQLFEPGALPTGDGSVTTYKDIMSLASEVGDSSLVYKFMSMASSNAIWSSRAAFGRFGLSSVLGDSSVDGYLAENPKLYPKLYRYRFDPNSKVQASMNEIWNALVKDSSATIEKHFDPIMEDLVKSILGKEWRVRQASCAAIADLVQGRPLEKYEKYLERIWTQCFKVLDDIKESVRAAAASLARVLTGILTRALEADTSASKNASAMLKNVLPFILSTSGLESSAQEVQAFALNTLLEIIKKSSGKTLRPFIPELVERLLGLLSSLEPQEVNYLHLNADKYNLTEQKIDGMRLSSIRSSPLMEAIERCLDLLDEPAMDELRPRLESAMKSAVGLPSKVGCSRVLVSLSTRHNIIFRPHSDHFLRLIEKHVLDRNETVSSSYAAAAGYVARGASDKQILQAALFARRLYFESEGDREQVVPRRSIAAGEIVHAIAKHATDRFNSLAADILPFVFVAKHDSNEHIKELFQETWSDNVGGPRAVALYLKEIIALSLEYVDSAQWVLKHTAARAIADATTSVASMSSELDVATAELLWPALEKALGGKTWDGKEVVLRAFVKFVQTSRRLWREHCSVAQAIPKIAIREAKRQNPAYRGHALGCLANIAAARDELDMSEQVFDVAEQAMDAVVESENGEAMDIDGAEDGKKWHEMTLVNGVKAMCAAIHVSLLSAVEVGRGVKRVTEVASKLRPLTPRFAGLQSAVVAALTDLHSLLREEASTHDQADYVRVQDELARQLRLWA